MLPTADVRSSFSIRKVDPMKSIAFLRWVFALAFCAGLGRSAWADDPPPVTTTITIEGMHCKGCAKKVASKLRAVAGVASVEVDPESGTAVIIPSMEFLPSPRALWQAVVKARYKPVHLEGPDGTFTEEPKS
jgi:copper chaperone CopZ